MFFEEKNSSNKQFKTASKASIESHGWGGRDVIPKFSILKTQDRSATPAG